MYPKIEGLSVEINVVELTRINSSKMKHLFFIIMMMCSIAMSAHKINGYKFVHVEETGNLLGVEDRLSEYLSKIGFQLVASYEIEDMSNEDKALLLFVTYDWTIVNGGHSTLIVKFIDVTKSVIYTVAGQGISFSAKGDMKNALKKIFTKMDALNYTFDPELLKAHGAEDTEFATWTEDSIRQYLDRNNIAPLEGIYKNYSNSLDYYSIAILKKGKTYYAVVIDSNNARWEKGETKVTFNYIDKKTYDVSYYDFKGKKLNSLATLNNRMLTFNANFGDGIGEWQFLKIYPSGNDEEIEGSDDAPGASPQQSNKTMKGTGSGFIVSGKVVATNFHVVDGASKITVTLTTDGVFEEYNARVLSVDKTNDLALVTIKDDKFIPLKPAPYRIATSASDVGTSVFTMGYPMTNILGEEMKITDGIISSKTGFKGSATEYQISAPIQPGNSGGALFDKSGNLIGITNAGLKNESVENVNYAIKTNYLLNLIDSAPIDIELPRGENVSGKTLPELIKAYKPYVAIIKVY
jgi:S1-C subfamily serine protease